MDPSTQTGSGQHGRRYVEYEEVWDNLDQLSINRAEMDDDNPYNPILVIDWHLLEQYIAATPEDYRREWWLGLLADAARRLGGKLQDFKQLQSRDLLLVALTAYRFNRRYGESVKLLAVSKMAPSKRGRKAAPFEERLAVYNAKLDEPLITNWQLSKEFDISESTVERWISEVRGLLAG